MHSGLSTVPPTQKPSKQMTRLNAVAQRPLTASAVCFPSRTQRLITETLSQYLTISEFQIPQSKLCADGSS